MEMGTTAMVLQDRVVARLGVVGVIGLGYVGLPLAALQAKAGYRVIGVEDNLDKVNSVNHGKNYVADVNNAELAELAQSGLLTATTDITQLAEAEVVIICVPTPLTSHKEPDLSNVLDVVHRLKAVLRKGQLVILESTTYPGTTRDVLLPVLESGGLKVGVDFFLAFSPERVDPGNPHYQTRNTPKLVGGVTPTCTELATKFYQQAMEHVIPVTSPEVAEMAKVFENTYRSVNIALVNEMAILCDRMHLDIWEVIEAAATKPFGIQTFYPGPGVGGHCIPLDPFYLSWKAREFDFSTRFIHLAGEINLAMPAFVVTKLQRLLNDERKALNGAKILLLGVAYKRDSNDERESPALQVWANLERHGAQVMYHDPYIPQVKPEPQGTREINSQPLTPEILEQMDAVVITTDHQTVDYAMVARHAGLIFDTRNAMKHMTETRGRLVRL